MQLLRAAAIVSLLVAALAGLTPADAAAHSGLVSSDPLAGATLGDGPAAIRLTFSERPEPSLSEIRVLAADGAAQQSGRPETVADDPLSLSVPVGGLGRGVYTVSYRAVSAVDGHATEGTYAFGVRASPAGASVATTTATPTGSSLELVARWIFLIGLVALIGGAVAGVARFGGSTNSDLMLAACGWAVSLLGLVLLAEAQRRLADSSLGDLFDTPVGRSLIGRGVAIGVAGAALLVAWRAPRLRWGALLGATLAALAAIAFHVEAGHAAAGGWPAAVTVSAQVAHFAAAGVWFGGLAALLLGIRGVPSAEKAAAVRRFAAAAAAALLIVVTTGTVRAFDELSSWGELVDSGYGLAVLAKLGLVLIIVGLAAQSRRRRAASAGDLDRLRRSSRGELVLAVGALGVAALLGTLAPPVAGQQAAPPGLSVSGADLGTTVRVELTAASDQPGPNRFVVRVEDYDSQEPVQAERVRLRFTPLDDPGVRPTSLVLTEASDATYAGSGPNLKFDGRWEVTVSIEREADVVEVPLELDLPIPEQEISILRLPDQPPEYTMLTEGGFIRLSPDPERAGPSQVYVNIYTGLELQATIERMVLTAVTGEGPARRQPVRRLGRGRFVADVDLEAGPATLVVVARTRDGQRVRGAFELDVPSR